MLCAIADMRYPRRLLSRTTITSPPPPYISLLAGTTRLIHARTQVSNLGTTTLANIVVTDAALAGDIVCPEATLAPGESMTCSASEPSAVTTKDLYMGSVVNTASVVRRA